MKMSRRSCLYPELPNPNLENQKFFAKSQELTRKFLMQSQEKNQEIFIEIRKLFGCLVSKETQMFIHAQVELYDLRIRPFTTVYGRGICRPRYLSIHLPIYVSIYLPTYISAYLPIYLSMNLYNWFIILIIGKKHRRRNNVNLGKTQKNWKGHNRAKRKSCTRKKLFWGMST
jgi:hypothetical protein